VTTSQLELGATEVPVRTPALTRVRMHGRIAPSDVLAFFQQLSTMIAAGTQIYEAILIAQSQCQSTRLKSVLGLIARRIAAGHPLHEAMTEHRRVFSRQWIEVVRSAEESGQLEEVLDQLAAQIERALAFRSKITSAMFYPAMVALVSMLCVVVLIVKVVPTFAAMFQASDRALPPITAFVLDASDFLRAHALLLLAGVAVAVFLLRRFLASQAGRYVLERLVLAIPVAGELYVAASMQRFANNAALLLKAGLPINEIVGSLGGIFGNSYFYSRALQQIRRHVEQGGELATAVERSGVFTPFAASMIRVGEQAGELERVLVKVECFYRGKVETAVERVTRSLETLIILVMGVLVAGILLAIYLPMFSMAGGAH